MRKIAIIFSLAVFCLMSVQCSEKQLQPQPKSRTNNVEGLWDPIELDNAQAAFSFFGGTQVITALNYSVWWINGGYEGIEWVDGHTEYVNYVFSESTDGREACTYDILDGGWYRAYVPEKGRSNRLVITVSPNMTGDTRKAYIAMESGDAFTRIPIVQD